MIDHIQGTVYSISPDFAVLKHSGVAYRIAITEATYKELVQAERATLFTYTQIKETEHNLFGFTEPSERSLFKNLISAKGVGCSTAIRIFNGLTYDEIIEAIRSGSIVTFKSVRGIGLTSAKNIIEKLQKQFQ